MARSALSGNLILLTAGAAIAGVGTGVIVRPGMAPTLPPAFQPAAPRVPAPGNPAKDTLPSLIAPRIEAFQNAGSASGQISFALQFASLNSAEVIRALLQQSSKFPEHSAAALAKVVLLKRWMELEPAGALSYCRIHANVYLPKLVADFSREKPEAARALVLALPSGKDRTNAWQELCALALAGPPDVIWSMLAAPPIRDLDSPNTALGPLTSRLVRRNPEAALARLETLPSIVLDPTRRALAGELTRLNAARGWAWALEQPRSAELLTASLRSAMAADPAAAMNLLGSLPPAQQREVFHRYRMKWDIPSAAALADGIAKTEGIPPENKAQLAGRFLIAAAVDDPAGADALVPLLAPGILDLTLNTYLGRWAEKFPPGAATWIRKLPPGPFRTSAEQAWNSRMEGRR